MRPMPVEFGKPRDDPLHDRFTSAVLAADVHPPPPQPFLLAVAAPRRTPSTQVSSAAHVRDTSRAMIGTEEPAADRLDCNCHDRVRCSCMAPRAVLGITIAGLKSPLNDGHQALKQDLGAGGVAGNGPSEAVWDGRPWSNERVRSSLPGQTMMIRCLVALSNVTGLQGPITCTGGS